MTVLASGRVVDVPTEEMDNEGKPTGRWGRYLVIGSGGIQFFEEPRPTVVE